MRNQPGRHDNKEIPISVLQQSVTRSPGKINVIYIIYFVKTLLTVQRTACHCNRCNMILTAHKIRYTRMEEDSSWAIFWEKLFFFVSHRKRLQKWVTVFGKIFCVLFVFWSPFVFVIFQEPKIYDADRLTTKSMKLIKAQTLILSKVRFDWDCDVPVKSHSRVCKKTPRFIHARIHTLNCEIKTELKPGVGLLLQENLMWQPW